MKIRIDKIQGTKDGVMIYYHAEGKAYVAPCTIQDFQFNAYITYAIRRCKATENCETWGQALRAIVGQELNIRRPKGMKKTA